jgi:hypothetical protein
MERAPNEDPIVEFRSPYWLRVTVTSAAAHTWIKREAPAFGALERSTRHERTYNLFIDFTHDPQEVAHYLANQGQVQQRTMG